MPAPSRRPLPALVGGGVLVVALGFGLPRLLTDTRDPGAAPAGPGVGTALLKMGAAVVVAGGLCVAAARYAGPRAATAAGPMTVAGTLRLDGRCVLQFVRAGDRRLLVGTDAGGVKALVELPRREADEPPAETPAPNTDEATVLFSRVLAGRLAIPHGGGP